ncbi:hypothetical protein [Salmonella phage PVPSE1]|uniref:Uncharacterized protein 202 n=1 Tax=Salmonella phage PVPSE1 TaxID=889338 RepID=G3BM68_9CAUD|nr:hypothetical protein PVP-SE1_gp202 [Salmonella phage PVPSE1]ADP02598.1 hypothetical protein [Salmonella phage PVPSE1]
MPRYDNCGKIPEMLNPFCWVLSPSTRSSFRFQNRIFSLSLKKFFWITLGTRSVFQNRKRIFSVYRKNFSARFSIEFSVLKTYFFYRAKKFFRDR